MIMKMKNKTVFIIMMNMTNISETKEKRKKEL